MAEQHHLIQKQILEIKLTDERAAHALQKELGEFISEEVLPDLTPIFDRYASEDTILRLDTIELNLGRIPRTKLKEELRTQITASLDTYLNDVIGLPSTSSNKPLTPISKQSREDTILESLFFFLRQGYFPWWAPQQELSEMEALIIDLPKLMTDFVSRFFLKTKIEAYTLKRLLNTFSMHFFSQMDSILAKEPALIHWEPILTKLNQDIQSTAPILQRLRILIATIEFEPRAERSYFHELINILFHQDKKNLHALNALLAIEKNLTEPVTNSTLLKQVLTLFVEETPASQTLDGIKQSDTSPPSNQILNEEVTETSPNTDTREDRSAASSEPPPEFPDTQERNVSTADTDTREDQSSTHSERQSEPPDAHANDLLKSHPDEPIFLKGAGIVLLHPFFEQLFSHMGYVQDKDFTSEHFRHRAVHLLGYLTWGQAPFTEPLSVLAKYFCQLPLQIPLEPLELTQEEREEGEALLKAAINHWSALKNTTPEGLREAFLQREGKLALEEKKHRLQIEQKTYDMLISKLPWTLSMIKLPWKKEILYVDWA